MEGENKLKKTIIKLAVAFLGIVLIFTIISKTIYTFLLPQVTVGKLNSGKIETKILAEGKIGHDKLVIDKEKVVVKAPVEGEITKCYVQEEQLVKKGDPLIKIKKTVDEQTIKSQERQKAVSAINESTFIREEAEYQEKKTEINKKLQEKQKKLESNEKTFEMISLEQQIEDKNKEVLADEELYKAGAISANEFDKVKEELVLLKKQKESLEKSQQESILEEIEQLEESLQNVESELAALNEKMKLEEIELSQQANLEDEVTITSPIQGRIYEIEVALGASVLSYDQLVVVVPDNIPITLSFSVDDKAGGKIKVGEEVRWNNDQKRETANVMKKQYNEENGETIVTCEVDSKLTESLVTDYKVYKDVDVEIINTSGPYDLLVPSSAIVNEGPNAYVYTIETVQAPFETNYVVHKNMVTIIKRGDYMSAIDGVFGDEDEIVKTTTKPLKEGAQVGIK